MAFIDSTIREKNITYPTDAKLHKKIIKRVLKIVREKKFPLRQSYRRTLKKISLDLRFRNHPKNHKKAVKADRSLHTIAGRLVRELDRNLPDKRGYEKMFEIFYKIFLKNVTVLIRYTHFTNRKYNVSARARNTRNMSLATKPLLSARSRELFLMPFLSGMNMMGIL